MNYLGKPTQGKGFAVVTLTKRYPDPISRGPIDVYRSAIAPKKAEPLTRAARRAQRVQDRPRRRRRSGRSCATERSEGAPVLAQRPAALARSLQAMRGAARRAPVVDGSTCLLPPPLALALAPQASVGKLLRRRALRSAE